MLMTDGNVRRGGCLVDGRLEDNMINYTKAAHLLHALLEANRVDSVYYTNSSEILKLCQNSSALQHSQK